MPLGQRIGKFLYSKDTNKFRENKWLFKDDPNSVRAFKPYLGAHSNILYCVIRWKLGFI